MEDGEQECVITIVSGEGLASKDANGFSDPYCKCEIREVSGNVVLKNETRVVKKTLDPVWGERLFCRLPADGRLCFEIWDWDRIGGHDFMGQCSIGARELRAGETQLRLEAKGREEVKGTLKIACSFVEKQGTLRRGAKSHILQPGELQSVTPNAMGMLPVHRAAYIGDLEHLRQLTEQFEALATMSGWTPLQYAVWGDEEEAVKLLLEAKVSGLGKALAMCQSESICKLLVGGGLEEAEKDVDAKDGGAVVLAAKRGKWGVLKVLLDGGAAIDRKDVLGRNALYFAVRSGSAEGVALLLGGKTKCSYDMEKMGPVLKELQALKPSEAADVVAALRKFGIKIKP